MEDTTEHPTDVAGEWNVTLVLWPEDRSTDLGETTEFRRVYIDIDDDGRVSVQRATPVPGHPDTIDMREVWTGRVNGQPMFEYPEFVLRVADGAGNQGVLQVTHATTPEEDRAIGRFRADVFAAAEAADSRVAPETDWSWVTPRPAKDGE